MINQTELRDLADYAGEPTVSSVYLDVDGRRRPVRAQLDAAFESLADGLRRAAVGDERLLTAVKADVEQMRDWLARRLDRSSTRGVGMFACSGQDWFVAVPLPRPVRDSAALGRRPRLAQLAKQLGLQARSVVALVDHRRLRLLHLEFGGISELPGLFEPEPRAVDTSVQLGSFEHHNEEAARIHFRRAAERVERALADWPAQRLIVGGPDDAVAGLDDQLSPAMRGRICGRVSVRVAAPLDEIATTVRAVAETFERSRQDDIVEELRQRAAGAQRGVVGLEATLDALEQRRVATLVVSEGFVAPGGRCPGCGHIGVDVRQCPRCATTNIEIDDVVELAVDEALAQRALVEFCQTSALDQFGRIGAIERY